jgi:hypothetical protein
VQKFDIYKENKDKSILISGFADAESCFSVFIDKNRKLKIGWSVQPSFVITLHIKPPGGDKRGDGIIKKKYNPFPPPLPSLIIDLFL